MAHAHQVSFGPASIAPTTTGAARSWPARRTPRSSRPSPPARDEVVVNDSHWQMRNLRAEELAAGARLVIGDKPLSMTQGVGGPGDGDFDGAAFIGYHAGAGSERGVIGHTYSSASVLELRVNGRPHNEAGINADSARAPRGAGHPRRRRRCTGRRGRRAAAVGRARRREARARATARPTRCRRRLRRTRSGRGWRGPSVASRRWSPTGRSCRCAARSTSACR